jgi:hypothetical protein
MTAAKATDSQRQILQEASSTKPSASSGEQDSRSDGLWK